MQLNPPNRLDAEAQRIIDDLYWNSTSSAKSLAERFGLTSQRITKLVTPLPVGVDCWWCRRALTWSSRSERSSNRDLVCGGCGALTSTRVADPRLQSTVVIGWTSTGCWAWTTPRTTTRSMRGGSDDDGRQPPSIDCQVRRWPARWSTWWPTCCWHLRARSDRRSGRRVLLPCRCRPSVR